VDEPIPLATLPELDVSDLRMLWVSDWYDGPLEAIVRYAGRPCRMVIHDPDLIVTDRPWTWVVFALSPEAWVEEQRWHALFLAHVGSHGDLTGEPLPEPSGQTERFYEAYRARPSPEAHHEEAIGYITSVPEPLVPRVWPDRSGR